MLAIGSVNHGGAHGVYATHADRYLPQEKIYRSSVKRHHLSLGVSTLDLIKTFDATEGPK
jgi:hypothetical protein